MSWPAAVPSPQRQARQAKGVLHLREEVRRPEQTAEIPPVRLKLEAERAAAISPARRLPVRPERPAQARVERSPRMPALASEQLAAPYAPSSADDRRSRDSAGRLR